MVPAGDPVAPGGERPPAGNVSRWRLTVVKGPQRGAEFTLAADAVQVGKAADNDLVLVDETVSRHHFSIVRDARGYLVRDLRSTNGTFLDGAEIKEAYLRLGSVIGAGATELRFSATAGARAAVGDPVPVTLDGAGIDTDPTAGERLGDLVGRARGIREVFGHVERAAPGDAAVLIEGEPGVGKTALAHALHAQSVRRGAPLSVVECGASTGTLLESQLFGHEPGAFAGAVAVRPGALEAARGGTVLLEDVDELPLATQPRLLRALEQRQVVRLGGARAVRLDVRVVATSRRDLRAEVERGKFRAELYRRLAEVAIVVPPLRDRPEDVPVLVAAFLGGAGRPPAPGALLALAAHAWPGNVAELRDAVGRGWASASLSDATVAAGALGEVAFHPGRSYRDTKEQFTERFERAYLAWLLRRADGNISRAARDADMDRKYLHKLLRRYGLAARDVAGDDA